MNGNPPRPILTWQAGGRWHMLAGMKKTPMPKRPFLPIALVAALAFFAPVLPARADCIGCGPGTADWMTAELGQPLPPGVAFTGVLQGGFQDVFVQIRLAVPRGALDPMLAALGTSSAALIDDPPLGRSIVNADWWGLEGRRFVRGGAARFGHFPYAAVFIAPEPDGSHSLWLIAFQT
jgi:hypothetical protein